MIKELEELRDAYIRWNTSGLPEKREFLEGMRQKSLQRRMSLAQLKSALNQADRALQADANARKKELLNLETQTQLQKIRASLAFIGIIIGVSLYGFYFHRRFL